MQEGLPTITAVAAPEEILRRLDTASRRGRLAGFEARPEDGVLFVASAHGHPFDSLLVAHHEAHEGGSRLSFGVRMLRRMPVIFLLAIVFSVWPGVYFMDELVAQLLPNWWRPWVTYWWYLPLSIIPAPWMWASAMRKSRRSASDHAGETITKIAGEIGGRVDQATPR
jgi:hypothetical protein